MADNRHDPQTHPELAPLDLSKPEMRHEHRDVDVWAIGKFGIGLILLSIVSLAALFGVYQFLLNREGGALQQTAKGFNVDARHRPPAPQLEETPVVDWQRQLAAEEEVLHSYAWVNQREGTVRIPIDRAIDLIAQRGLPTRAAAAASDDAGVSVPTASSLGAKVQQPGGPLHGELYGGAGQ